jgi:hypothetical protein
MRRGRSSGAPRPARHSRARCQRSALLDREALIGQPVDRTRGRLIAGGGRDRAPGGGGRHRREDIAHLRTAYEKPPWVAIGWHHKAARLARASRPWKPLVCSLANWPRLPVGRVPVPPVVRRGGLSPRPCSGRARSRTSHSVRRPSTTDRCGPATIGGGRPWRREGCLARRAAGAG